MHFSSQIKEVNRAALISTSLGLG